MRLTLTWRPLDLALTEPFVSHKGVTSRVRQTLVTVTAPDGSVGYGAVVYARELGLTAEASERGLCECVPAVEAASPFGVEALVRGLEASPEVGSNVIAGVEMALQDWLGRRVGLPLRQLWGLDGLPLPPTALSLGDHPVDELLARARRYARWPILKLKMTPQTDLTVPSRLREVYGGRLWIDGNGAWDVDGAARAARVFHAAGVELLEQPVRPGALDELRAVHRASPVAVVADEDCRGAEDILRLADAASVVNLKLLKCGGLLRAREAICLARQVGLGVMLGCKTESALGVTAMAQLGGLADHLDLDGHLDVVGDPFVGAAVEDGGVSLPAAAGVGVWGPAGGAP